MSDDTEEKSGHDDENHLIAERRAKLAKLRERGNAFPNDFRRDALAGDILTAYGAKSAEALDAAAVGVRVAGRMRAKRVMGKASFAKLEDSSGAIQIFLQQQTLGEAYGEFKGWDVGDVIGAEGTLFRTKTGELSVRAHKLALLTKSLRPLPDKWHGIADTELRYRRRYVDLIMNEQSRRVFETRSRIVRYLRAFLDARGFLEVETPMLHPIPGGAAARPFKTHHNALDVDMYLRIAPELYLKRLTVGGFERVYEINRNFRNEGVSTQHNPEFTMLELYQAYADYTDLMEMIETLFQGLADTLVGSRKLIYQGTEIDLSQPFARRSIEDIILANNPDLDPMSLRDASYLRRVCDHMKIPHKAGDGPGKLQIEIFERTGEHTLVQPTFAYAYPAEVSPRQRRHFGGIRIREGGLHQRVLAGSFENLDLQFSGAIPGFVGNLHVIAYPPQIRGIAQRHGIQIGIVRQNDVFDGSAREGLRKIDFSALVDELPRPHQGVGETLKQGLDHLHEIRVIRICLIQLQHCELGVVLRRHAFVAEISVDFVNTVEAADGEPLEIEFRRDAQIHVYVEGVVVRLEGPRSGAAGNGVQHRRLHLQEAARIEKGAQVTHDPRSRFKHPPALLVHDQIDIAAPVTQFCIGDPVPFIGQRPQRLGQQCQFVGSHRQLAGFGAEQGSLGADHIADIPTLELVVSLAERLLLQENLYRAARVFELGKTRLAHDSLGAHPAGHSDANGRRIQRLRALCAVSRQDIPGQSIAPKVVRKRVAALAQFRKLRAPLGDQMILVVVAALLFDVVAHSRLIYRPCFRLACMNSSSAPSSTAVVLPISTPVRRSLMRD